ncbi:MAG: hypothetical protein PHN84_09055 [Desulfuromonadaceae bacterium]|nr:hypothetical protein [Desulfuromonadaceae bacterium]MDD2856907.1 hypothetical protein [Desulfuromonadaceae bacterium]
MANHSGPKDTSISKQLKLIDSGVDEGSFDIVLGLKQTLSRDLKGFDRYLVAAQISKATLKHISKDTLDKKLSSDPDYQPGMVETAVICHLTGSLEPFRYVLEHLGSDVLNPEDRDLIELARLQEQERIIKSKMDAIRAKRGLK